MNVLINCRVPSEDGVCLATDVYRPAGPGPFPTVLLRTPYHRVGLASMATAFVNRGYALVVQDCRGKYDSDGTFSPLRDEAGDGLALIDWAANQRWCNGRIGMWGRSYLGIVQVPAASGGHEALRCIVPSVAPGSFFEDWIRYDGCFALANTVRWSLTHASCRNKPPEGHFNWDDLHSMRLEEISAAVGFDTRCLSDWAGEDVGSDYWDAVDQTKLHSKVRVPGYHAGGWFDHLTRGQFDAYRNIRDDGATVESREGQRILIGPWGHKNVGNSGAEHCRYGQWDFGPEADVTVLDHELQCLDHYLQDAANGFENQPAAKIFLMGANRWLGLDDWPPSKQEARTWYLDSGGSANMRIGNGILGQDVPARSSEDVFMCDPEDPVPTCGGQIYWGLESYGLGPTDQRNILRRPDVLYYRSEKIEKPLAVVGDIQLELTVTSDALDTDFVAKICVEEGDGAVTCLTVGSLRCRYRNDKRRLEALKPGDPTQLTISLSQIAYQYPIGSRIGLIVTSSDFPRILPNNNTLCAPWESETHVVAAFSELYGELT